MLVEKNTQITIRLTEHETERLHKILYEHSITACNPRSVAFADNLMAELNSMCAGQVLPEEDTDGN